MASDNKLSDIQCASAVFSIEKSNEPQKLTTIKVYRRRYWMLFVFSFLSFLSASTFPQYVSMANVNICYYNITVTSLNWTVYIWMIMYVVLIYPASFCMNYVGLRWTVIAAAVSNTTACAIQFAGLKPDGFLFIICSTFFASVSNIFVLAVPPFLAATWFPSNELSRACAAGVFGNQLGVAVGYMLSPVMVSNDCTDKPLIETGKFNVATVLTSINLFWLVLVISTFQNSPKLPPTLAQMEKESSKSYTQSVLNMFKNMNFILLIIMYGLMVGSYFAITTILNNLVLRYFPNKEVEIGWMGMLFIICGLVGSIIAGFILDYTHRFKETTLTICIASLITFIIFCSLLVLEILWVTFLTIGVCGFFLTSFLPVGLEYGIELTFPEPEVISASILSASTCLFGLILTEIISRLIENFGQIYSNSAVVLFLFTSSVITIFITSEYKRNKKYLEEKAEKQSAKENYVTSM